MPNSMIIAVDHDRAFLNLIEDTLGDEGYMVQSYLQPTLRAESIYHGQPDLLLLELRRSDHEQTLRLIRQLRQHPSTRTLPIIVSSTDERLFDKLGTPLRQLRAARLPKPFTIDQLMDLVAGALDQQVAGTTGISEAV